MNQYVIEMADTLGRWHEAKTESGERKLFETATEAQLVFDKIPHNVAPRCRIRVITDTEE